MIFIDWMSTSHHANFNRAFFSLTGDRNTKLFAFSDQLALASIDCEIRKGNNARIGRAMDVFRICRRYCGEHIFLLTYDPIFIPIILQYTNSLIVFEHNTVPENSGLNKHTIWQLVFMRKILRLAQFPAQHNRLKSLNQNSYYVGSPLLNRRNSIIRDGNNGYYIAPSYRFSFDELQCVARFVQGFNVVVKTEAFKKNDRSKISSTLNIKPVNHITLEDSDPNIRGIIITVQSRIRGSNWFNEAISSNIPIIITNENARYLFEETFPEYPYVDPTTCHDQDTFDQELQELTSYDSTSYIIKHNQTLRQRFEQAIKNMPLYSSK